MIQNYGFFFLTQRKPIERIKFSYSRKDSEVLHRYWSLSKVGYHRYPPKNTQVLTELHSPKRKWLSADWMVNEFEYVLCCESNSTDLNSYLNTYRTCTTVKYCNSLCGTESYNSSGSCTIYAYLYKPEHYSPGNYTLRASPFNFHFD
jgi:hypothetical protein